MYNGRNFTTNKPSAKSTTIKSLSLKHLSDLFTDAQKAIYGKEVFASDLVSMLKVDRDAAQKKADRMLQSAVPLALGVMVLAIQSPDERTRVKAAFGVLEKSLLYTKEDKRKKPKDHNQDILDSLGVNVNNE